MTDIDDTDFSVRVRFQIPSRDRIGIDEEEIVLNPTKGPPVTLTSYAKEGPISKANWLIARRSGWPSTDAAETGAKQLVDALRRSFARWHMGVDFGNRSPQSGVFRPGLKMVEKETGRRTLNDVHGAMVFRTELHPLFARVGPVTAFRTVQDQRWRRTLLFALDCDAPLSERERTAFDLYSAAHAAGNSIDARFVLQFASIECLLEDKSRPESVINHVNDLISFTKDASLDKEEKESLLGTLNWLRSHSVRSSGRDLMRDRLGDRKYHDQSAERTFLDCYDLRNRLLHGSQPFPDRIEVGQRVGQLDLLVGDLLAGPVRDFERS